MNVTKTYRGLDKLQPEFRKKVELFLKEAGDKIFITESYRSQERQNYLYKQRPRVTWTLNSLHTQGIAIDIAFNGNELYPSDHYEWMEIAEMAKKYGIDWGYDLWGKDLPHFQDNGQPLDMGEFEKLFKTGSSKGECHIINDEQGFIEKWGTMAPEEQASYLMIMFNRLEKKD